MKKFKRWLVHEQFACLRRCFDDYNTAGGAIVTVNRCPIHLARATILALYGDHPACVKSTVTGSSCPTCFARSSDFADVNSVSPLRTANNMRVRRDSFLARVQARVPGDVSAARKEARETGVNIDIENGWISPPNVPSCFGPDSDKDNVHANSPSLMLHALDEELIEKLCAGIVKWAIHDGLAQHGYSATQVQRKIDAGFARTYEDRPLNSNVEVNGRDAFQLFPHGVVSFLLDKRRLNAKWYGPLTDQLQFYLMESDLLTPRHKVQMADLCHMARQVHFMVRQPVKKKGGIRDYEAYLATFITKLIKFNEFHTPSACRSIKYHCALHWGLTRMQLGCSPMEYSLERALGDNFTRFWGLTNHGLHGKGKDQQMAEIIHRHSIVADLCYHAGLKTNLRQCLNTVDLSYVDLERRNNTVELGKLFDAETRMSVLGCSMFEYESIHVARVMGANMKANTSSMVFPAYVSNSMKIPLQNRSVPRGDPQRIEVLTLRARDRFFGKQRYDNVMVLVQCDPLPCGRAVDIFFARCVAFYEDQPGNHFVALHWYEPCRHNRVIHAKARLPKVKPMNPLLPNS